MNTRQGETSRAEQPPAETTRHRPEPEEFVERTVEDVVLSRQAIRHFADRPVPGGLLVKLFSLAQRAPSDWNLQPWRWLVLRRLADRERLKPLAHDREEILSAPVVVLALANMREWERAPEYLKEQLDPGRFADGGYQAQLALLAEFLRDRPDRAREFAVRNTMLAVMTLILVAQSEGLANGFVGTYDEDRIRSEFQIPDELAIAMILTLGYPAEEPPLSLRKPLGDVVHWDAIGGRRTD
jgi:nitroreductase